MRSARIRSMVITLLATGIMLTAGELRAGPPQVTEGIINASAAEVWRALTTADGFRLMGVAHAEVDLAIGGEIRTHYDPQGELGDPDTIVNEILAYDPGRMLAIRVKRAPEDFPFREAVRGIWSVFYLTPLGEDMTHLKLVGLGYRDDRESLEMREYFAKGNRWTLDQLAAHYAPKCARCEAETAHQGLEAGGPRPATR